MAQVKAYRSAKWVKNCEHVRDEPLSVRTDGRGIAAVSGINKVREKFEVSANEASVDDV